MIRSSTLIRPNPASHVSIYPSVFIPMFLKPNSVDVTKGSPLKFMPKLIPVIFDRGAKPVSDAAK